MRIVIISERWEALADEGVLIYLSRLASHLSDQHQLRILYERGEVPRRWDSCRVGMGRGLASRQLISAIQEFQADLVLYCPTACATLGALIRQRRLERGLSSPCALISLQARSYPAWIRRWLLPRLRPWRMIVLSRKAADGYRELGYEVLESRGGVDLERFRPANESERATLRVELELPDDLPIILHVGHLAAHRNLDLLASLARDGRWCVVMVASAANAPDPKIWSELEEAGVTIRHGYVARIEDYYRASDIYVFPVTHRSGAIEFPLSVLEAMACGVRVLTTPFGALPEFFEEGDGLRYLDPGKNSLKSLETLLAGARGPRDRMAEFSWPAVFRALLSKLQRAVES